MATKRQRSGRVSGTAAQRVVSITAQLRPTISLEEVSMRTKIGAFWAGLVSLALFALAAPAFAHFDTSGKYTHSTCPGSSSNRVDPINVVFYGWGTWDRALSQIQSHAGWADSGGSTQYFVDHGNCAVMHGQRASAGILSSRFHIRVRGQHSDPSLGWTATGDAHHEDFVVFPVPCGHAVDSNGPSGSGFDQGRNRLESNFASAGHTTFDSFWGNSQNMKQCDGDLAHSDGWLAFIRLHQVNH
jgi:hypothetical protein